MATLRARKHAAFRFFHLRQGMCLTRGTFTHFVRVVRPWRLRRGLT